MASLKSRLSDQIVKILLIVLLLSAVPGLTIPNFAFDSLRNPITYAGIAPVNQNSTGDFTLVIALTILIGGLIFGQSRKGERRKGDTTGTTATTGFVADVRILQLAQSGYQIAGWRFDNIARSLRLDNHGERILGMFPGTFNGSVDGLKEIFQSHQWDFLRKFRHDLIETGLSQSIEIQVTGENRRVVWLNIQGQPEFNAEGECVAIVGVARDITHRKQMQSATVLRERGENLLIEFSGLFAEINTEQFRADMESAVEKIGTFIRADGCWMIFPGQIREALPEVHGWHAQSANGQVKKLGRLLEIASPVLWRKFQSGDTIELPKLDHGNLLNEEESNLLRDNGITSALLLPVRSDTRFYGLLICDYSISGYRRLPRTDGIVTVALRMLSSAATRMVTSGKVTENELRMNLAVDGAGIGLWDWDIRADELFFSRQWLNQFGYEHDDLQPEFATLKKLVHPDDYASVTDALHQHIKGKTEHYEAEYRLLGKSGAWHYVHDRGRVIQLGDEGKPVRVAGACTDITARKKNEQKIEKQHELNQVIVKLSSKLVSLPMGELDIAILDALADIGRIADVDRAYIFEFTSEGKIISNTYEWCAEGVPPQQQNLQQLPSDQFPWWMRQLRNGNNVIIPSVHKLTDAARAEKEILLMQGIHSLISVPMWYGDKLTGFIGFDAVRADHMWHEESHQMLRLSGDMIANALERRKNSIAQESRLDELEGEHRRNSERLKRSREELESVNRDHSDVHQALHYSEARNLAMLNAIPDVVMRIDKNGVILDVKATNLADYNLTPYRLLNRSMYEIFDSERAGLHMSYIRNAMESGSIQVYEFTAKNIRNEQKNFEARISASAQNEVIALIRDITDRQRQDKALRETAKKMRAIFDSMHDAIVISDLRGVILEVNAAAAKLLGYPREETFGLDMRRILTKDCHVILERDFNETTQKGFIDNVEYRFVDKEGNAFPTSTSFNLLRDYSGKNLSFIVVFRDITEQRALEEQLRQAQKMEAIGRLAGGVAHDFNNLLTVIRGSSELLLYRAQGQEFGKKELHQIVKAAQRATALTRKLLVFSRKETTQHEVIDLNMLVQEMAVIIPRLIGEDIVFKVKMMEKALKIKVDSGQIEQVMMNLVVNARDAMPQGGRLVLETDQTVLDAAVEDNPPNTRYAVLSIYDTGTGIASEVLPKIFEPFFTTKARGKGTGLGLSMVYGIVKQNKGKIEVTSELGMGTAFRIFLPLVSENLTADAMQKIPVSSLRGKETILIVEDEEEVRGLVAQLLTSFGYRVYQASTGKEALELCHAHGSKFDMLLSDVVMPEMNGGELAEAVKEICPGIRITFMSGYPDDDILRKNFLNKDTVFIEKPFTPLVLAKKVREALDQPRDQF
jgi:two-component system cell cycle sensor histidine kinase/response regulator CckA